MRLLEGREPVLSTSKKENCGRGQRLLTSRTMESTEAKEYWLWECSDRLGVIAQGMLKRRHPGFES
jgi:hypothetical protein